MVKKKEGAPELGVLQVQSQTSGSKWMTWLVWGALVALVILLLSAFSKAWATNQALQAEIAALEPVVAAQVTEKTALEAQLTYVKSDEYVEEWAQTQAGMARASDTLVRPIGVKQAPAPTPQVIEVPIPAPSPESFWSMLWRSLTGD
jgi:cell division protein FtsB